MQDLSHHFRFFGKKCRDKITGFQGVGASVCFDVYGCIQTCVTPPAAPDKDLPKSCWFDNNRLEIVDATPVMDMPAFMSAPVQRDAPGGFEKPDR